MPTPWDFVDERMDGGKNKSAERQQSNMGTGGDYGAIAFAPTTDVPLNNYPNVFGYGHDSNNPEFSSDKSPTPDAMASESAGSMNAIADLQHYLLNSPYVMGSRVCHEANDPWSPPHPEAKGPGDGKTGID